MKSIILGETAIAADSLSWKFHLSSGPGGQNAAKVSTAVELRLNVGDANLEPRVASRLRELAGTQVNRKDELVINARKHRTQERNRREALDRLTNLLDQAMKQPKARIATRPTRASKNARLDSKRRQSEKKRSRSHIPTEID